jgi:putative membrane protein
MREGAAWIHQADIPKEDKQRLLRRLSAAVWCLPRSMTRHLLSPIEDEEAYVVDCRAKLRPELAEDLIAVRHRPARALYELSCAINELPLSEWRRISADKAVTSLCDAVGSNERIFSCPVPRTYTRHTARFLVAWLLFMPLTLYDAFEASWNHCGMIPATIIISFFLIGIEELGIQLEEPFSVLCVLCFFCMFIIIYNVPRCNHLALVLTSSSRFFLKDRCTRLRLELDCRQRSTWNG